MPTLVFTTIKGLRKRREGELILDGDRLPGDYEIRLPRNGDRFTPYGGKSKSLGDWFTSKKVPPHARKNTYVLAVGSEIYAVLGMEIADILKVTGETKKLFRLK